MSCLTRQVLTVLLIFVCLSLAFMLEAVADFEAGLRAYKGGNYETAMREFLSAAERGHGDAQAFLGEMYRKAKGVTQDYQKGANWYRRAADQGIVDAQYNLGALHDEGNMGGWECDFLKAMESYHLAAAQGLSSSYGHAQRPSMGSCIGLTDRHVIPATILPIRP